MNHKMFIKNIFQKRFSHYLLIIFVTLLSLGQILRLYFGFEDFHLFYLFQDPIEAKKLLVLPEYARHLNSYYFERPLWNMFGYNPFGYHAFTLVLSVCVYILYYHLVIKLTGNKRIGLACAVYAASSYFGINSFTWSYNTGFDFLGALIPGIIVLILMHSYLLTKKIHFLLISFLLFLPLMYFFQARISYFVFLISFLFLFYANMSLKKKFLFITPFIIAAIFILQKIIIHASQTFHVAIDPLATGVSFFATLGNLFFPSDISEYLYTLFKLQKYISLDIFEGIIGCGIIALLFFIFILLRKKNKKLLPFFFFSVCAVFSFIFFLFAASVLVSGISIRTTESWGHTVTPATLWTSALVGLLFVAFNTSFPKFKKLFLIIFVVLIGINIYLAASKIITTVETKSKKLRYFYTTVLQHVPLVDKPSVFYFDFAIPRPFYPFSSGSPLVTANTYIASYYWTNKKNIIYANTFDEAIAILKERKIHFDRFHYFHYADESLTYLSPQLKTIKNDETIKVSLIDNQTKEPFTISNTKPHIFTYLLSISPDFERIPIYSNKQELTKYYELFLQKQEERKKYIVEVFPEKSSDEYTTAKNLIDGDYTTMWLAEKWSGKGVHATLDLGETKEISHIVWASNRSAPLAIRQPSSYSVFISTDKKNWKQVREERHIKLLEAKQYYDVTFSKTPVRYVKIVIQATHGNYTPYVDEVEVFGDEFSEFNYETYYTIASAPLEMIPSREILERVFSGIYAGKLFYTINQKMDNQSNFLEDNSKKIPIDFFGENIYKEVYLPPKGLKLTGIQFIEGNFPLKLKIENLEIKNMTIDEVMSVNEEAN